MRHMSFFYTQDQVRAGTKTETSRKGWEFLKPGDKVMAVEKGMGLKKGEKIVRIRPIEIVKNEPIMCRQRFYTKKNVKAEGFGNMRADIFIEKILVKKCKCKHNERLNRLTFKYIEVDHE